MEMKTCGVDAGIFLESDRWFPEGGRIPGTAGTERGPAEIFLPARRLGPRLQECFGEVRTIVSLMTKRIESDYNVSYRKVGLLRASVCTSVPSAPGNDRSGASAEAVAQAFHGPDKATRNARQDISIL